MIILGIFEIIGIIVLFILCFYSLLLIYRLEKELTKKDPLMRLKRTLDRKKVSVSSFKTKGDSRRERERKNLPNDTNFIQKLKDITNVSK